MIQITPSEGFIFFGGIVLAAIISVLGNLAVASFFKLFETISRRVLWTIFWGSLVVVLILVAASFNNFNTLKDTNYSSLPNNNLRSLGDNCTFVAYYNTYNISQISVVNQNRVFSLKELTELTPNKDSVHI